MLTATLRERVAPVWHALLTHPFVGELYAGSLPLEKFRFYLLQDYNFLVGLTRTLAIVAAKSEFALLREVLGLAHALAEGEFKNYERLLQSLGVSIADAVRTEPAAVNQGYVDFLTSTAFLGSPQEGLVAVLPCFWSYQEIAEAHKDKLRENKSKLYVQWAECYLTEDYRRVVQRLRELVDAAAVDFSRALRIFTKACQYERMFWDMAYRLETGPMGS